MNRTDLYHSAASRLRRRIATSERWLAILKDGLDGKPHTISGSAAKTMQRYLNGLDIRVLTEAAGKREGLQLRGSARPIVRQKFAPPVGVVDLYYIEQFHEFQRFGG